MDTEYLLMLVKQQLSQIVFVTGSHININYAPNYRRRKAIMCSLSVTGAFLIGCMLFTAATASAQDTADQIGDMERERLRALVDADVETADRLHAEDFQLINPFGSSLSKDEYLGAIASGDINYLVWKPGDIEVKFYGDAAVIRYQAELQIKVSSLPDTPSGQFWHMDVYENRNGQWQVVWSQATQIQ